MTPGGKAMFQIMGLFAEFEHAMIQERIRASVRPQSFFFGWHIHS
jgi:DNA invertase Pin-like site-specific DNA recombinase